MFHANESARKITDIVVKDVAEMVTSTMGPNGQLAVIECSQMPKTTKDGVTVAKSIKYDDIAYDLVAQMMTEAAIRTDIECGDGTTTTVFLTAKFYDKFKDCLTFSNKTKLNKYVKEAIGKIKELIIPVDVNDERLYQLALTTSNNDKDIVDKVIDIYKSNNGTPVIRTKEGVLDEDRIEISKGLTLNGYFAHPSFSNNGTGAGLMFNHYVPLVFDSVIKASTIDDLGNFIDNLKRIQEINGDEPIVIFARGYEHEFMGACIQLNHNFGKKIITLVTVEAGGSSGTGIMGDVCTAIDTELLGELNSLNSYDPNISDTCIIVSMNDTRIDNPTEPTLNRIDSRIKEIEQQLAELSIERKESTMGRILQHRINRLIGGEVVIYVGGLTTSDIKERIDRYVDVIQATKTALEGGVLPGCGSVLAVVGHLINEKYNDDISIKLFEVLSEQYKYLMDVSSINVHNMKFTNLATGETSESPDKLGIYDAANATITALEVALKTSIMLASVSSVILGNKFGNQSIKIG